MPSDFPTIADLTNEQEADAVPSHKDARARLQKKMGQVKEKEKEVETMRYAASIRHPHVDLSHFPISQKALRVLPKERVQELGVVCFFATTEEFRLGALDPETKEAQELLKELQQKLHAHGALYVVSERSFDHVLELYKTLPTVKAITKDIEVHAEDLEKVQADVSDFASLQQLIDGGSTSNILTVLLGAAFKMNASDFHIEAEEDAVVVRFRLDGLLHEVAKLPSESYKRLISRIKLVSSLKINVTTQPQDGRFTIKLPEGDVDVRVSTIPTVYGESVVMRLLKQSRKGLALADLGVRDLAFDRLQDQIKRPNGMIITTGPTGSGKTTTLYAAMHVLNQPGVKIITLEDPVEYRMEGINQSQIDHGKGYTFAKGLRSMLRQDPDIAMVGEIRDLETADIAVQAALTGHLILSTIHTNSASGAIPRFLSMGVKPFLLAPALNCVIGQRLVRRLCQECKKEAALDDKAAKRVEETLGALPAAEAEKLGGKAHTFYVAEGCDACNGLGFSGRVGIYEIFVMNPEIEQMVLSGHVSEYDIEQVAIQNGMVTMVQDGLLKALDGLTSVEEVFRVIE